MKARTTKYEVRSTKRTAFRDLSELRGVLLDRLDSAGRHMYHLVHAEFTEERSRKEHGHGERWSGAGVDRDRRADRSRVVGLHRRRALADVGIVIYIRRAHRRSDAPRRE